MICVEGSESSILVVSENGFGKRSAVADYRVTNRGGKGVKTIKVTQKTGSLVAIKSVSDEQDLMIITSSGITIRTGIAELRVVGRATQGVKLIKMKEGSSIAAVTVVPKSEEAAPMAPETD